jgi:NAD(P)-dependent dehydrogenase (short-subunit alcohol dehydrogenase family)
LPPCRVDRRRQTSAAFTTAISAPASPAREPAPPQVSPCAFWVNAAATDVPVAVLDWAPDEWDRVMAVNLRAVYLL